MRTPTLLTSRRIASGEIRNYIGGRHRTSGISPVLKIRHLYLSKDHNYFGHHGREPDQNPIVEVDEIECVAAKGIRGDRFFEFKEDYKGQVTFFDIAVYERLCEKFEVSHLGPDVFRRNIITEGQDLNALIDQHFTIQGVEFFGTQEAKPCYWMNRAFAEGAEEALMGNGGLRARILSDGFIRADHALVAT